MKLIKYENFNIEIADEAYLVGPIRKLYNIDKTKGKDIFLKQMSLLYFIYDPRSNYAYITDEKERINEVETQEGINKKDKKKYWTKEFEEAIKVYKDLSKSSSTLLLQDLRELLEKMRKSLKTIDFESAKDLKEKVTAIKTAASITDTLPEMLRKIVDTEKIVTKEIEEQSKARGNSEMSLFDNGINME